MDKKLIVLFTAMVLITALVAGMMVGCVQINVTNPEQTKESAYKGEYIVVTLDTGENGEPPETVIIGVEVGERLDVTTNSTGSTGSADSGKTEGNTGNGGNTGGGSSGNSGSGNTGNGGNSGGGSSGNSGSTDSFTPATTPTSPTGGPDLSLTYEEYWNMTGSEQRAFVASFGKPGEPESEYMKRFIETWYDPAYKAYKNQNQAIEVTGDNIDLEDYNK